MSNKAFKHELSDFLPESISKETSRNIKELKDKIDNERISLVLGAGVSQSVELPGWYSMLNMIFGYLFSAVTFGNDNFNQAQNRIIEQYLAEYGHEKLINNLEKLQLGKY